MKNTNAILLLVILLLVGGIFFVFMISMDAKESYTKVSLDNKTLLRQNDSLKKIIAIEDSVGHESGCAVIVFTGSDDDLKLYWIER